MIKIEVINTATGESQQCTFREFPVKIGRARSNDLVLGSPKVSKHHSEFYLKHGQLYMRDLKSRNGTYLNGEKIFDSRISGKDTIYISDFEIKFATTETVVTTDTRIKDIPGLAISVVDPEGRRKEYHLDKEDISLGRSPDNDIILGDKIVSRRHARIFRKKKSYYIEDLNSNNGTLINGKKIKRKKLKNEIEIYIGAFLITIYIDIPKISGPTSELTRIFRLPYKEHQKKISEPGIGGFQLKIFINGMPYSDCTFDVSPVFIGRRGNVQVVLEDPLISSRHAKIEMKTDFGSTGFIIEDLRSSNGTFINGERIEFHELKNGDRITIGNFTLVFILFREKIIESRVINYDAAAFTIVRKPVEIPGDFHKTTQSYFDIRRLAMGMVASLLIHLGLLILFPISAKQESKEPVLNKYKVTLKEIIRQDQDEEPVKPEPTPPEVEKVEVIEEPVEPEPTPPEVEKVKVIEEPVEPEPTPPEVKKVSAVKEPEPVKSPPEVKDVKVVKEAVEPEPTPPEVKKVSAVKEPEPVKSPPEVKDVKVVKEPPVVSKVEPPPSEKEVIPAPVREEIITKPKEEVLVMKEPAPTEVKIPSPPPEPSGKETASPPDVKYFDDSNITVKDSPKIFESAPRSAKKSVGHGNLKKYIAEEKKVEAPAVDFKAVAPTIRKGRRKVLKSFRKLPRFYKNDKAAEPEFKLKNEKDKVVTFDLLRLRKEVGDEIDRYREGIEKIYTKYYKNDKKQTLYFAFKLIILPSGKLKSFEIVTAVEIPELKKELEEYMGSWTFSNVPAEAGGKSFESGFQINLS